MPSTPVLTRNKMDQVLHKLKTKKARDPHGFINEVFKLDMIGDDMKESLFLMCYKIRDTLEVKLIVPLNPKMDRGSTGS